MPEGVLQAADQVLGGLPIDNFTVCLAGMTQDNTKDVGTTPPTLLVDDRSALAEVNLRLLARCHFDPSEGQRSRLPQPADEPTNTVILPLESVFLDQILKDPLSRQALVQLADNRLPERLALTPRPDGRFGTV
jgi:hypothetical protein